MRLLPFWTMSLAVCASMSLSSVARAQPSYDYRFVSDSKLGTPGFSDYVTFDLSSRRLFIAHLDQITVFDTDRNVIVGSVGPIGEAHGVAVASAMHKAYVSDGKAGVLKVIDLATLRIVREIKVADDVDGVIFDAKTGMILAMAGDAKSLSIVDPRTEGVRTIALPGQPEYLAANKAGKVFINIVDLAIVAKVDIASGKIQSQWPLEGCGKPHGLAYDPKTDRLFSSCANGRLVVLNGSTGANLAILTIGQGSDAVVVDSQRGLVFSSNADGTLNVISEEAGDVYRVVRTIPTFFGGRNMTIDPSSGALYVVHGETVLTGGVEDKTALRFRWDGVNVARFEPRFSPASR